MYSQLSSGLLAINSDLIRRFEYYHNDYRLYPRTDFFVEAFDAHTYSAWLGHRRAVYARRPLSLYVHIPFCRSACFYCPSNQFITDDYDSINKYLEYLALEIKLQGQLFKDDPRVEQLYLGGGIPTFLNHSQLSSVMNEIQKNFNLIKEGDFCIEIDSRQINNHSMAALKEMGFNCAIIGVQDFAHQVQQSICCIQTEEATLSTICSAQQAGFKSIKIELTYGLPKQSMETFEDTLEKIISTHPNQINLLNYLCLFGKLKPQYDFNREDLPDTETVIAMMLLAISRLTNAGYTHIGMNLFAKREDSLVIAQRQGRLHYSLQGYSIYPDCYRIALGISAVGSIGPTLNQNHCDFLQYYNKLEHNILPIMHGIELSADDLIRRSVMQALICQSILSFESMETFFPIEFKYYFATELTELLVYEQEGLIALDNDEITVTPKGQLLIISICRVFDKYRRTAQQHKIYPVRR